MSPAASEQVWQPPALGELLRWGLPAQNTLDAWVVRGLALLARQQVLTVIGLDHIRTVHDPFIVAINHSTRTESLLVPALMVLYRGGRLVHFFDRDPARLLPGHRGAAYLSLTTGTPVIPVGIRFPEADGRIGDHARMEVEIGAPLAPPPPSSQRLTRAELHGWHATLMGEISRLAGKPWSHDTTLGDQP
jgi:1-acyl-sn-glycerol-3-phosphate acyltransferase